jgi:flagellin
MPNNSINTNVAAFVALQNLNTINGRLDTVQNRVSTGLKVSNAVDDASSFAIAQGTRGNLKAFEAVSQGLANARGVASVTLAAATSISDLLGDIQKKITEGQNAGNSTEQQSILNADFSNLVTQINTFITNATYNGRNLLSSFSTSINVLANIDGTTLTIRSNSAFSARSVELGSQNISSTVAKLSDASSEGLGSIVDADLTKESSKLQALQVQQQLSVQTLSIANGGPRNLLDLFR